MRIILIALALMFGAAQIAPALAQPFDKGGPPGNKGKGNAGGNSNAGGKGQGQGQGNSGNSQKVVIVDKDRTIIRDHFAASAASGNCPPGLAKKNNGCMPPGQARKWTAGQVVPAGVTIYALPDPLLVRLTPPPVGYRYGRIDGEVVLLAIQTNVIIDVFAF
jgi:Ni/Co efflux regulator RcnB